MTKANDLASLLDANGDVVSTALDNVPAAPTPSLSSLGIPNHDDVTVDASGNVGIGGSASRKLHVIDSGNAHVAIQGGTSSFAGILLGDSDNHTLSRMRHDNTDNSLQFSTNEIERLRIDSSGRVGIGDVTSASLQSGNNTGNSQFYWQGNYGVFASDNDVSLICNRQATDGGIIALRKDGSTVGSIGSVGGDIYVGTGNVTLRYNDGGNDIRPATSNGSNRDNLIDLGDGGARFKDLYLSGGVYLGGTGSANYLDDYEEGTWSSTPNVGTYGFNDPRYTKIGRMVHCHVQISSISDNSSSQSFRIQLPFAAFASNTAVSFGTLYRNVSRTPIVGGYLSGTTEILLYIDNTFNQLLHSDTSSITSIYAAWSYMAAS